MGKKYLLLTLFIPCILKAGIMPSQYSIKALYNHGKIDGFVQIPRGGKNGTTSIRRPDFDELGIDKVSYPEFEIKAKWDKLSLYSNVKYKKFDGSKTLQSDLLTHSRAIPMGATLNTKHEYISYSFGAQYDIYKTERFTLSPLLEYSIYDFSYKYDATILNYKKISGERSFGWGQINYGLKAAYQVTDRYSIDLTYKEAIKHDSVRKYRELSFMNSYTVYSNGNNKVNLLFGIGYEKFKYRDTQYEKQNFMKHKISPVYKAGIEYLF